MGADVIPFRPRKAVVPVPPVPNLRAPKGFAVVIASRAGSVSLTADDVELEFTPMQARELALDLMELARDAEGHRG